jgi:2-polyprenyl-6-methoxyphenol hydroxylase-like FAD-dependent oxidoreductase
MLDAFRDAELLAGAADRGLDGDLDTELAAYQQARDTAVMAMYEFTYHLAKLDEPPSPEIQALMAALVDNQTEADRFFGVMAGTVEVDDFYAPANVARIIESAANAA